jgi:zinc transporter 9
MAGALSGSLASGQTNPNEILLMTISMFVVTFIVGFLPTKMSGNERAMTLLTLFGAGLLVGAALIVILPEGMSVLYKSVEGLADMDSETINRYTGASLVFGFIVMLLIDQGF